MTCVFLVWVSHRRQLSQQQKGCELARKIGLGHYLRDARMARGLSAAEVAERAGVSTASVYFWESARNRPRDANLVALCGIKAADQSYAGTRGTVAARLGDPLDAAIS
jgi:transcriptional regulator with XRE-family HTH domain